MDTALYPAIARRPDAAASASGPAPLSDVQTVSVVAVYRLSEVGRKASLLAGGNGRERQQVALDVPVTRLHLVHVDPNGTARLKLKPRFELRAESQRVVRADESPQYDAPPSTEALLQDAARNHQLEATYQAQGVSQRSTRTESSRTWRDEVAVSFLSDATRRVITHPSPTPRRCVLATDRGRMDFDAKRDRGAARDVPLEAHRRFQADLRARRERAQDDVTTFHAAHAEKQRLVGEWTTEHGTDDQRARLAASVLPIEEIVEAMTAQAFAAVAHLPVYGRDGATRLQAYLRAFPPYAEAVVSAAALAVTTRYLSAATSAQWAVLQQVKAAAPDAQVFLRERVLSWTADPKAPRLRIVTVLGFMKLGPLTLRREFCIPEMCSATPESDGGPEN